MVGMDCLVQKCGGMLQVARAGERRRQHGAVPDLEDYVIE